MAAKDLALSPVEIEEATPSVAEPGEVLYLWMTRKEICDHLAVPPHTLYRMVQRGEVECNREGEQLRYRPAEVDLDLADLESRAEEAAATPTAADLHRTRYLDALVALVDGLTERLVHAETVSARAQQERDGAVAVAKRSTRESMVLVKQLNAYCTSLVESNSALHDANGDIRMLKQQLGDLRGELLELAGSALALPVRSRLLAMSQRADAG